MTVLLKQIFGFLKLLNSDKGENQIAVGIACGLILGFAPSFSLQTLIVIVVLFFFRIQIGAAMIAMFFFAIIAWVFDPVFDSIGRATLEISGLKGLFTTMYNMPIIPFTKFNNSVVMGSLVLSFILAPLVFVISKILIIKYRISVFEKFKETKFFKGVKATGFYKWYAKYDSLYN
jgi:uncharacterized protein (TIGR03546 family)